MRNNCRPTADVIAQPFSVILLIILAVPVYYTGFVQAMEFWKNYGILKRKFHIWKNYGI